MKLKEKSGKKLKISLNFPTYRTDVLSRPVTTPATVPQDINHRQLPLVIMLAAQVFPIMHHPSILFIIVPPGAFTQQPVHGRCIYSFIND